MGCDVCKEYGQLLEQAKRMRIEDQKANNLERLESIEETAARCIEIAEPLDKHVAMMLRKEFNLPKAG